jgi:site-specific recombinase XerD
VSGVTRELVNAFVEWRAAHGTSPATISRDLAALRGPINWALKEQIITYAPRIAEVKGKTRRRELEYSPEQVAAILDAAWAAGHSSERGSGANYTHLRPAYLREFLALPKRFGKLSVSTPVRMCDTNDARGEV